MAFSTTTWPVQPSSSCLRAEMRALVTTPKGVAIVSKQSLSVARIWQAEKENRGKERVLRLVWSYSMGYLRVCDCYVRR